MYRSTGWVHVIIVSNEIYVTSAMRKLLKISSNNRLNTFSLRRYEYIPSPMHPSQPNHHQSVKRKRPDLSQDLSMNILAAAAVKRGLEIPKRRCVEAINSPRWNTHWNG